MSEAPADRPSVTESASEARLRTLLVAVDLTPISDRVLARVALLPLADDARIVLLHVIPGDLPMVARSRAERDAARALADELQALRRSLPEGVSVEPVVGVGSVAGEIVAHATSAQAELVVLGRGGGRALRDVFLGSTAERVIRQAQLPVLAVRLPARFAYSHPAAAIELDEAACEVLAVLLRLVPPPRPRVIAIHAIDTLYRSIAYPGLTEEEVREWSGELERSAREQMSKLFTAAVERANVAPGEAPLWAPRIEVGSARLVIEGAVKLLESDLLVLGTHGHSGIVHWVLGTVSGDVLRSVACDVLIVPGPR